MRIILQAFDHINTAAVRGYMLAGAVEESAHTAGLTSLAARVVSARLHRDEELYFHGALASCAAGRHITSISARSVKGDLPVVLAAIQRSLNATDVKQEEIERERALAIAHARSHLTKLSTGAQSNIRKLLYGADHPYGRLVMGSPDTIQQIRWQSVVEWLELYGPQMIVVGVLPSVSGRLQGVEADFYDGTSVPNVKEVRHLPLLETKHVGVIQNSWAEECQMIGTIGPSSVDLEYYKVRLASLILGSVGILGYLGEELRGKGLVYECASHVEGGYGPGPWIMQAILPLRSTPSSVNGLWALVDKFVHEPRLEQQLSAAKRMLLDRLSRVGEDPDSLVQDLSRELLKSENPYQKQVLKDKLDGVTPYEIQSLVAKYWLS